jgi:type IV secretory pathway component VirB8
MADSKHEMFWKVFAIATLVMTILGIVVFAVACLLWATMPNW